MSDLRVMANVTPGRVTSDGQWIAARGLRGGEVVTAAFSQALSHEGRLFAANFGSVTTPLATPATTAITALRPAAWVRVPDATLIVPIAVELVVESTGITTQGEAAIVIAQNDIGNGTSSAGTAGPLSLNTAAPLTSNCTVRQLATGDVTASTNPLDIKRFSFAASAVDQSFSWSANRDGVLATLRGAASLILYLGGNAVNFYAQVVWAELPETNVS